MTASRRQATARLRIHLAPDIAMGPGKADLLEGIAETGSIAAAGRRLGMSYKRAWMLVDTMNACYEEPLVVAHRGGHTRGGAQLTATGERVLGIYRGMEAATERAIARDLARLRRLLRSNKP